MVDDFTKNRIQKVGQQFKEDLRKALDETAQYFSMLENHAGAQRLVEFSEAFYRGIFRTHDALVGSVISSFTEVEAKHGCLPTMIHCTHMAPMSQDATVGDRVMVATVTTRVQTTPPVGALPVAILRKSHHPFRQVISDKTFIRILPPVLDPIRYLDQKTKPFWIKDANGILTTKYWVDGIEFTHELYYSNLEQIFANYLFNGVNQ